MAAAVDNICLAITKQGRQCKNSKQKDNRLFCGTHNRSLPEMIILDGGPDFREHFGFSIRYTNEVDYFNQLETMKGKYNVTNGDNNKLESLDDDLYKNLEDDLITCHVCYNKFNEIDELIRCNSYNYCGKHSVCYDCMIGYMNSLMSEGIASMDCMFSKNEKCGGIYKNEDINRAFGNRDQSRELIDKWNELVIMTDIVRLGCICENYMICPLCCKWGCIFEPPVGAGIHHAFLIKCGKCDEEWCTLCKRKSHNGRSCYYIDEKLDDSKTIILIDKLLQDTVTRIIMHCCSVCGCSYIKDDGCNLMTCPKCQGMSCYICGMRLYTKNTNKYWHFIGHDLSDQDATCPLWNNAAGDGTTTKQGNKKYNIDRIIQELQSFLTENKNNKSIHILIKKRIVELWKKDKDFTEIINQLTSDLT